MRYLLSFLMLVLTGCPVEEDVNCEVKTTVCPATGGVVVVSAQYDSYWKGDVMQCVLSRNGAICTVLENTGLGTREEMVELGYMDPYEGDTASLEGVTLYYLYAECLPADTETRVDGTMCMGGDSEQ